jgi:hypothetical protein
MLSILPHVIDNWSFSSILNVIVNAMKNTLINKVILSGRDAQKAILRMSPQEKRKVETALDVEHAYYSSALEGSKIDRTEFEKLAESVKA